MTNIRIETNQETKDLLKSIIDNAKGKNLLTVMEAINNEIDRQTQPNINIILREVE
jgi:EAL domain-containing protein (putative c-di-GMP-specific phosphodiesterase class I)